ncbi:hypothetical protein [Clostridium tetani]|uniref:Uncharacterized protein n=1 Tax=Clostridium tetani TaxID=1513 RepID=A0ABY0ET87_CLOTA|nr:hypothetical protein [Clostridium tetani]RXI58986.1 hypothetical protein DP131_00510 [Clostridium tetani]
MYLQILEYNSKDQLGNKHNIICEKECSIEEIAFIERGIKDYTLINNIENQDYYYYRNSYLSRIEEAEGFIEPCYLIVVESTKNGDVSEYK